MPCKYFINYLNLYLLLQMNLVMDHLVMWMIVYCWPIHFKNVLKMYFSQFPCYSNWDLSYTQQSLYLYQYKKITFLGFEIDTLKMSLTLTSNKKENIRNVAPVLLLKQSCSIRTFLSWAI